MAKKILLIVEGDSDEVKFLKYLFNILSIIWDDFLIKMHCLY